MLFEAKAITANLNTNQNFSLCSFDYITHYFALTTPKHLVLHSNLYTNSYFQQQTARNQCSMNSIFEANFALSTNLADLITYTNHTAIGVIERAGTRG